MDRATNDTNARLISGLLLIGAALAVLGNALHPFLDAGITTEEFLAEAAGNAIWIPVHFGIGVAIVMLTVGLVLFAGHLRGTAGAPWANLTATLAVMGGTVFAFQIAAIDGVVIPALAEGQLDAAGLAAANAIAELDTALLSVSVVLFLGATFLALGWTLSHAEMFAPWIRWTAMVGGAVGLVVGVMMMLDLAPDFTFLAFRVVALATTAVAVGLGVALRKAPAGAPAAAAASG